jgi:hypothetical protein
MVWRAGVLVRHLVMPGLLDDTREIMHWLGENLSRDTYVNVMDQYYPAHKAETEPRFAESTAAFPATNSAVRWNSRAAPDSGASIPVGATSFLMAHPSGCRECETKKAAEAEGTRCSACVWRRWHSGVAAKQFFFLVAKGLHRFQKSFAQPAVI